MNENRDYLEMAFQSIRYFADDGRLDVAELDRIVAIAERDGVIDDNERRVLGRIFVRLQPDELDAAMRERIAQVQKRLGASA
jgi:hypothetical protein